MAKWITLCFLVICVAVIFLTFVDDADAARGRFSSRTRYSGARYGTRVRVRNRIGTRYGRVRYGTARYGSVRVRQRIRYRGSSRMYKGSYGLTRSTWKNAFLLGTIYHGPWYLRSRRYHSHPTRMPTICRNNYETDDNNTVYNLFYCPRFFEPDDFDYCCGPELREYCCKYFDSPGRTAGIVIGVLLLVIIVGIIVYCVCKKRSNQGGKVLSPFSKPQPAYAPAPTMTYAAPVQPPPAAAGPPPGYPDAGQAAPQSGYPPVPGYIPPSGQPGPPDQPHMGYYPPPQEVKPGLPPGEVSHGGMPYPAQPAGYPPPDGGMYPPPGGYGGGPPGYEAVSTEYPPPQPGPYPPPTGPGGYPPPTGPGGYPPPTGPGGYPPPQPPGY
ncbi:uncharacterized protein LOC124253174 isoform X2 [Haliotis rubra]|uniref:uncharacterized protein LOC124253174 isoform X2 n=1 Tax=Haliotis rubra TaxID=36100 RepID=UPI001EE59AE2|nr:uncharacterized protein LOC124253174 isoform X2 [Haliotis rubra]